MTTTSVTCDRCQQPALEGRVRLSLTIGNVGGLPNDVGTGRPSLDLCQVCAGELAKWLADSTGQRSV